MQERASQRRINTKQGKRVYALVLRQIGSDDVAAIRRLRALIKRLKRTAGWKAVELFPVDNDFSIAAELSKRSDKGEAA